jgi:hypothetical protein
MSNKIYFSRSDLEKIQHTINQFPDVDRFCLSNHGESGIGSLIDLVFDHKINGIPAQVTIAIIDQSSW